MIAYCWANGVIGFGRATPDGAIEMARGSVKPLRRLMNATSRLTHDNQTLLVPGVPEAPDQNAAADALLLHLRWLKRRPPAGVSISCKSPPLPLSRAERRLMSIQRERV